MGTGRSPAEILTMKAMVTGGAGFIGSTLVDRLLAEGHEVDVVDDLSTGSLANLAAARADRTNALKIHRVDLRDPTVVEVIERQRPAVIFHLAAQVDVRTSVADPVLDATVNVLGSLNVLEGARRAGAEKVVFASSGGTIYGDVDPADLPLKESHPQRPVSPYGVAKKSVVDYLHAYRELHELEYTALALGNVYGPRQDPHGEAGVVAIFCQRILADRPLTVFGDGMQTRDYVHVRDVVDATYRAATQELPPVGGLDTRAFNVGTGVPTSVLDVAETLRRAAGCRAPIEFAPKRAGEQMESYLVVQKAKSVLGWRPRIDLEAGLADTFAWFAARRSPPGTVPPPTLNASQRSS